MSIEAKQIIDKLDTIKAELDYIKDRLVDADLLLTDGDLKSLREAEKDLKEGRTKRI